ncbi:MAG: DNA topology modulation protein [Romboutsia sp.]|uniref:DNA topology modulation protein n=1 Tax=Romboutsia sp. TaxID=1965302 RepID=UPI003F2A2B21
MKIVIIGYSGSGKSTLAKHLAGYYKIPVLFLDKVNFLPNWVERDRHDGRLIVNEFMKNDSWVIDGNYKDFYQSERLEQADKIIFMNFPRRVCIYRAFKRYFKYKNTTREDMASGCVEKIDLEFMWWILYKGRTKEKQNHYKEIEEDFKNKIVVLRNKKEVDLFLGDYLIEV